MRGVGRGWSFEKDEEATIMNEWPFLLLCFGCVAFLSVGVSGRSGGARGGGKWPFSAYQAGLGKVFTKVSGVWGERETISTAFFVEPFCQHAVFLWWRWRTFCNSKNWTKVFGMVSDSDLGSSALSVLSSSACIKFRFSWKIFSK